MPDENNVPDDLVDERAPGFYIVDEEVIDEYGARIGPLGVAVYNVLVRHANKSGTSCFPSYQTIADKLGITRNTAIKGVEILLEHKLILKQGRTNTTGAPTSNLYRIRHIKKKAGQPKEVVQNLHHPPPESAEKGSAGFAPPSPNIAPGVVQNLHRGSAEFAPEPDTLNQTQLNQTHTHIPGVPAGNAPGVCVPEVEPRTELKPGERVCACRLVVSLDLLKRYVANHPHLGSGYINSALQTCNGHELIRDWLERVDGPAAARAPAANAADCPDCQGTGMYYPDGLDKGVARCKHPRLAEVAGVGT